MNLSKSDYKTILSYYKISFARKSDLWIKKKAEDILANKLCRCIKKVKKNQILRKSHLLLFVRILYLQKEILKVQSFLVKKNTFLKIIKIGVIN